MTTRDQDHVRLLSIAFYVMSGLTLFMGFAFTLFFWMIYRLIQLEAAADPAAEKALRVFLPWMVFIAVQTVAWAIVEILTGRFIQQRKHYLFCLIICAFSVLSFPHGTALGVAGFVVLSRPSVKAMFAEVPPIVSHGRLSV